MKKLINWVSKNYLILIFLVSGAATFGSLYFSIVEELPPCDLCWYQRIFIYPLFILSTVSLAFAQPIAKKFLFALSLGATLIAAYHVYIQNFPVANQFVPCTGGISCSSIDWTLAQTLGIPALEFVTIPFLSLLAGLFITGLLVWKYFQSRK